MIALQLHPPLFVVTPKGDGIARIVFDYGPDMNPVFLVELNDSREMLCFDMIDIRGSGIGSMRTFAFLGYTSETIGHAFVTMQPWFGGFWRGERQAFKPWHDMIARLAEEEEAPEPTDPGAPS